MLGEAQRFLHFFFYRVVVIIEFYLTEFLFIKTIFNHIIKHHRNLVFNTPIEGRYPLKVCLAICQIFFYQLYYC